jgi:hypothetical protein
MRVIKYVFNSYQVTGIANSSPNSNSSAKPS